MESTANPKANYTEMLVSLNQASHEIFSYELFNLGALGIEETKEQGESLVIKIYFESGFAHFDKVTALVKQTEGATLISQEEKETQNWQENWKEHFKPLLIGKTILVRPPWEEVQSSKIEVVINPGLGFGTGYHESTALALESLEELTKIGGFASFIDVGAGSGILAIAALKLGAKKGMAIEIEKEALLEIPINLELSGLSKDLVSTKLGGPELVAGTFELVIANITGDVLLELAVDLTRLSTKYLLLSGIAPEYVEPLKERFSQDFDLVFSKEKKPWNSQSWVKK